MTRLDEFDDVNPPRPNPDGTWGVCVVCGGIRSATRIGTVTLNGTRPRRTPYTGPMRPSTYLVNGLCARCRRDPVVMDTSRGTDEPIQWSEHTFGDVGDPAFVLIPVDAMDAMMGRPTSDPRWMLYAAINERAERGTLLPAGIIADVETTDVARDAAIDYAMNEWDPSKGSPWPGIRTNVREAVTDLLRSAERHTTHVADDDDNVDEDERRSAEERLGDMAPSDEWTAPIDLDAVETPWDWRNEERLAFDADMEKKARTDATDDDFDALYPTRSRRDTDETFKQKVRKAYDDWQAAAGRIAGESVASLATRETAPDPDRTVRHRIRRVARKVRKS